MGSAQSQVVVLYIRKNLLAGGDSLGGVLVISGAEIGVLQL